MRFNFIIDGDFEHEDVRSLLQALREIESKHPERFFLTKINGLEEQSFDEVKAFVEGVYPKKDGQEPVIVGIEKIGCGDEEGLSMEQPLHSASFSPQNKGMWE